MTSEPPDVIPCPSNPDFECVRTASQTPTGEIAAPPDPGMGGANVEEALCPEGYVPRRRRDPYTLEGKVIRRDP